MPPATRNAGIEIPTNPKTVSPNRANNINTKNATPIARMVMLRRALGDIPWVRATNSGVKPMGSMITNRATNDVMRKSMSMLILF